MELSDFLKKIVEVFENLRISYIVTGSVAAMTYGEPRLTNDIDIVAEIQEHQIEGILAGFPISEFYLNEEAIKEAILHRTNLMLFTRPLA